MSKATRRARWLLAVEAEKAEWVARNARGEGDYRYKKYITAKVEANKPKPIPIIATADVERVRVVFSEKPAPKPERRKPVRIKAERVSYDVAVKGKRTGHHERWLNELLAKVR